MINKNIAYIVGDMMPTTISTGIAIIAKQNAKLTINEIIEASKVKPYKIEPRPNVDLLPKKIFVCKGKHQYRQQQVKENNIIKVSWVCECGRTLH